METCEAVSRSVRKLARRDAGASGTGCLAQMMKLRYELSSRKKSKKENGAIGLEFTFTGGALPALLGDVT
eukprot:7038080-Prymnesium_polylepis.1